MPPKMKKEKQWITILHSFGAWSTSTCTTLATCSDYFNAKGAFSELTKFPTSKRRHGRSPVWPFCWKITRTMVSVLFCPELRVLQVHVRCFGVLAGSEEMKPGHQAV